MRERLVIDTIRCESQIGRLTEVLARVRGLDAAFVQFGASAIVVDYESDETRQALDAALASAGFDIASREIVDAATATA